MGYSALRHGKKIKNHALKKKSLSAAKKKETLFADVKWQVSLWAHQRATFAIAGAQDHTHNHGALRVTRESRAIGVTKSRVVVKIIAAALFALGSNSPIPAMGLVIVVI